MKGVINSLGDMLMLPSPINEIKLTGIQIEQDGKLELVKFQSVMLMADDVLTMNIRRKLFVKMSLNEELAFGADSNRSRAERRREAKRLEKKRRLITI